MANRKFRIKQRNAVAGYDVLYPETIGEQVLLANGTKTAEQLNTDVTTHMNDYVRQPGSGVTTGSANTYALTLTPALTAYTAFVGMTVQINAANTGASTINVNGLGAKSIRDSKGVALTAGKLVLNGVYTLRYDGTNFILQGEGGSGDALASDLLLGKKASTDAGDITGTMPSKGVATITPSTVDQTIAAGQYLSGIQTIASLGGSATAAQVLAGVPFSSNVAGRSVAGTMPNRAGDTTAVSHHASGTSLHIIPAAGYVDGVDDAAVITDANFVGANIKSGVSIFGQTGTMPSNDAVFGNNIVCIAPGTHFSVTNGTGWTPEATIQKAGQYRLFCNLGFFVNASPREGSSMDMVVYKNGISVFNGISGSSNASGLATFTYDITLAVGDKVRLLGGFSGAAGWNVSVSNFSLRGANVSNAHF